jgi:LacI family transcriptional regulator
MAITTKDIAKMCGVSRATVDRALKGKAQIKEETKVKILQIAKEYDYRPDILARSLVKGKSMSIGVVVFDIYNEYFTEMLSSIQSQASERGYFVYYTFSGKNQKNEIMLINSLIDRRADGIIVCPINKSEVFNDHFKNVKIPIVTIGNRISGNWNFVGINDRETVSHGLSYILSKGYERVIFVCPPYEKRFTENIYAQEERVAGFMDYFAGMDSKIESALITHKNYVEELKETLSQGNKKTAVFCSSDTYALELLKHIKVSQTVGFMGFDNVSMLEYITPKLTTIDISIQEQAVTAVDTLINLIQGIDMPFVQFAKHRITSGDTL